MKVVQKLQNLGHDVILIWGAEKEYIGENILRAIFEQINNKQIKNQYKRAL